MRFSLLILHSLRLRLLIRLFVLPYLSALLHILSSFSRLSHYSTVHSSPYFSLRFCCISTQRHRKISLAQQSDKFFKVRPGRVKIIKFRRRYCGFSQVKLSSPNGPDRPALSTAVVVGPRAIAASLETLCNLIELNSGPQGVSIFCTGHNTGDAPREAPSRRPNL